MSTDRLLAESDNAVAVDQHVSAVGRDLDHDLGRGLLLDRCAGDDHRRRPARLHRRITIGAAFISAHRRQPG